LPVAAGFAILRGPLVADPSNSAAVDPSHHHRTVYGETAMAHKDVSSPTSTRTNGQKANLKRRLVLIASGLAIVLLCVALRSILGTSEATAQLTNPFRQKTQQSSATEPEQAKPAGNAKQDGDSLPHAERPKHDVMAVVNGQDIRRDALASACVERFGDEVLEDLVNQRLIMHHCRNRGIEVTDQEIEAEIDRMAARFKIGREQWLQMLERERGVNVARYKRILWQVLALRKCAADELAVSEEQLKKAHEAQFGQAVKCRLIVVQDRQLADQLQRQLTAQPADFPRLAMQHSVDVNSASIGGLIQPIRRHVGDPTIERAVFSLQQGQISPVIPVGEQFAILKCEGQVPARNVPLESVREELSEQIREDKVRDVANARLREMQDAATVQNVWNNPQLRAQLPGVVATINGEQVPYSELAEECVLRYGEQVLEIEISHLLLQQALAKANLTVTDQDLNAEVSHAAQISGVVDKEGKPDLQKWMQMATEEQGVTKDQYFRDAVWPSAALKKLTGSGIQVSQDDLQKGFEANYSERVRCRAIVLPSMRKAQEVWGKARQNASMDYFGDLAEEYSIEPTSKSLRGEVPPIRRYGGQPQLEDVAFQLKEGELSGIIQLGDQFVILKCQGRTTPVEVKFEDVQQVLHEDIFEKKLRVAMNEKLEDIRSKARIDNFLAGTSQAPERVKDPNAAVQGQPPQQRVDSAVVPTSAPAVR
jgi:parvulin-like peptidyl-prolyl isomerase